MWPPAIRVRPLGSWVWPAQKRFLEYGTPMKVPEAGSQRRIEFGARLQPSQARTCPVGSRDMSTATKGQETGALHCPI